MKNALKLYYRLDARLKPVSGSMILRRKTPRNGRWKEVKYSSCCQSTIRAELIGDPSSISPQGTVTYILTKNTQILATITQEFASTLASTLTLLVRSLNTNYSSIATFSLSGNIIYAAPKAANVTGWQAKEIFTAASFLRAINNENNGEGAKPIKATGRIQK